jgi:hypothetical protein
LTLKEGSSGGGPPDFSRTNSSGLKDSINSLPRPAQSKEKPAGLSRRV